MTRPESRFGAWFGVLLALPSSARAQTCLVTTPIGPGHDVGTVVALQPDGKNVQGGYISYGSNDDFVVVRYNTDFALDPGRSWPRSREEETRGSGTPSPPPIPNEGAMPELLAAYRLLADPGMKIE